MKKTPNGFFVLNYRASRQAFQESFPVGFGKKPGVEDRHNPPVPRCADQPAQPLL
jgi:hypothetical protein